MLLQKHRVTDAVTRDEIDHFLRSKVGGAARAIQPIDDESRLRCNAILSDRFKMFSITCKFEGTFDYEPFEDIRLVFPVESFVRVKVESRTFDIDPGRSNYILAAGAPVTKDHRSEYRVLSVRVSPMDLMRKLEALSGERHSGSIRFQQPDAANENYDQFVRRPLFAAARKFDQVDPAFHANLVEDIRALTLTRLLLLTPHNFSRSLAGEPRAPSTAQMRLAEEYIATCWDKPLNVSGLANASGVSARTILRYFRNYYGETPRAYLRSLRLERAHEMLQTADDTTVTKVALNCGFSSLGHFAQSYYDRYGELPSDTRRRICPEIKPIKKRISN